MHYASLKNKMTACIKYIYTYTQPKSCITWKGTNSSEISCCCQMKCDKEQIEECMVVRNGIEVQLWRLKAYQKYRDEW